MYRFGPGTPAGESPREFPEGAAIGVRIFRPDEDLRVSDHQKSSVFGLLPEASNIIAPKAPSFVRSSAMAYSGERVAGTQTSPIDGLRPRRCLNPDCNAMFALCRSCDRGQRYCSDPCRKRMRRQQLLAAGHRYQASEAGKEAHRHRKGTYRHRKSRAGVTHQGPVSITISPPTPSACLTQCAICGQANRWTNPFYWLPGRRRRPRPSRRSANVQDSTFLHDR